MQIKVRYLAQEDLEAKLIECHAVCIELLDKWSLYSNAVSYTVAHNT
jgi:hypothetical protein